MVNSRYTNRCGFGAFPDSSHRSFYSPLTFHLQKHPFAYLQCLVLALIPEFLLSTTTLSRLCKQTWTVNFSLLQFCDETFPSLHYPVPRLNTKRAAVWVPEPTSTCWRTPLSGTPPSTAAAASPISSAKIPTGLERTTSTAACGT